MTKTTTYDYDDGLDDSDERERVSIDHALLLFARQAGLGRKQLDNACYVPRRTTDAVAHATTNAGSAPLAKLSLLFSIRLAVDDAPALISLLALPRHAESSYR
jgi:hypothetical protein